MHVGELFAIYSLWHIFLQLVVILTCPFTLPILDALEKQIGG